MIRLILVPSMFAKHTLFIEIDKSLELIGTFFIPELLNEIPNFMEIYEVDILYIKKDKTEYVDGIIDILKSIENLRIEVIE